MSKSLKKLVNKKFKGTHGKLVAGLFLYRHTEKGMKFLALQRPKNKKNNPLSWEPPGGKVDIGETPIKAVKRETAEECGYEPSKVTPIKKLKYKGRIYILFAAAADEKFKPKISSEHLKGKWFKASNPPKKKHDVLEWILNNEKAMRKIAKEAETLIPV